MPEPESVESVEPEAELSSPAAVELEHAKALTSLDSSRLESDLRPSMNRDLTNVAAVDSTNVAAVATGSWQWTPAKETAASLVADGERIREIAQRVGVSEKTIDRWKQRPEFRSRIDEILGNFGKQLIAEALARLDRDE